MREGIIEVAVDKIHVRGDRSRLDLGNVEQLASRIERAGRTIGKDYWLINPILVESSDDLPDGEYYLVSGERRLRAHELKGWPTIRCICINSLDEQSRKLLEIEENVSRMNFSWQEVCLAVRQYHLALCSNNPGWRDMDTARELGKTPGWVSYNLTLAEKLVSGDKEIWASPRLSDALKVLSVRRHKELLIEERNRMFRLVRSEGGKVKAMTEGEYNERFRTALVEASSMIISGDAVEVIKSLPDGKFSVITDPPYGIDIASKKKIETAYHAVDEYVFEDSEDTYFRVFGEISKDLYRVSADNSFAAIFFGIRHLEAVHKILTSANFSVRKIPCIWVKTNITGQTRQPHKHFGISYEAFFVCIKGSPVLGSVAESSSRSDVFSYPVIHDALKVHPTEKPVALLEEIIKYLTAPGQIVLDPFAGSGSTIIAALKVGRRALGIEKDEVMAQIATRRIAHFLVTGDEHYTK